MGLDAFVAALGDRYMTFKYPEIFEAVYTKSEIGGYDAKLVDGVISFLKDDLPEHSALRVPLLRAINKHNIPQRYFTTRGISRFIAYNAGIHKGKAKPPVPESERVAPLLLVRHKPHTRQWLPANAVKCTVDWFKREFLVTRSGTKNDLLYLPKMLLEVEIAFLTSGYEDILIDMSKDPEIQKEMERRRKSKSGRCSRLLVSYDNALARARLRKEAPTKADAAERILGLSSRGGDDRCSYSKCALGSLPILKIKKFCCQHNGCALVLHKSCALSAGTLLCVLATGSVFCERHVAQQDADDEIEYADDIDLLTWPAADEFESDDDGELFQQYRRERNTMNATELQVEKEELSIDTSFLLDMSAGSQCDSTEKNGKRAPHKKYTCDRIPLPVRDYDEDEVEQIYSAIEKQNEEMWDLRDQQADLVGARAMQRHCSRDGCQRNFNRRCSAEGGPFCRGHCITRRIDRGQTKTLCRVHRKPHELATIQLYHDPIARAHPIFPWDLRTLWRVLRANVRFSQKFFPHPCTIHKGHALLVENLRRLAISIKKLLQNQSRTTVETLLLKRLLFKRHALRHKFKLALIHFVHDKCNRQYVQEVRRTQSRTQAVVVRDFGSRYNSYGQKMNICCFGVAYKDTYGASQMWYICNICCVPGEQKEDWAFYKTTLDFHFQRRHYQNRGFFRRFTDFLFTGDRGPHFICHRSIYFESTLPSRYGVRAATSTYCPKHSYNENDGLFGSLNKAFNHLEAQGVALRSNADYCRAFVDMKENGKFANVEMWPFDRMDRSEVFYQAKKVSYNIKLRSTFKYSIFDEKRREISVPGVFRSSFLPTDKRPIVVDVRKDTPPICNRCSVLQQCPVIKRAGPHHLQGCSKWLESKVSNSN